MSPELGILFGIVPAWLFLAPAFIAAHAVGGERWLFMLAGGAAGVAHSLVVLSIMHECLPPILFVVLGALLGMLAIEQPWGPTMLIFAAGSAGTVAGWVYARFYAAPRLGYGFG